MSNTSVLQKIQIRKPNGTLIESDWRPRSLVRGLADDPMIYMGAQGGYGRYNGYIARVNPQSALTPLGTAFEYSQFNVLSIDSQSVTSLLPYGGFLVGGTWNALGVGTDPIADCAQLFLYCAKDAGVCAGKKDKILAFLDLRNLTEHDKNRLEGDSGVLRECGQDPTVQFESNGVFSVERRRIRLGCS